MSKSYLDKSIEEMRNAARQLTKYTFPDVGPIEELEIDCLKRRQISIDGYDVLLHFSIADFADYRIESLEVCSVNSPFLPMYLVCKLGVLFLGGNELKYSEKFRRSRKVYIWTVAVDRNGKPIAIRSERVSQKAYDEFKFFC